MTLHDPPPAAPVVVCVPVIIATNDEVTLVTVNSLSSNAASDKPVVPGLGTDTLSNQIISPDCKLCAEENVNETSFVAS